MENSEIKKRIKESRILQYEVAAKLGVSEYGFCKWFRKELTAEQQERILKAIDELKGEMNAD